MSDTGALGDDHRGSIAANPGQAAAVAEKPQAIGWFVGQVMKATGGKANPGTVNQLLKESWDDRPATRKPPRERA